MQTWEFLDWTWNWFNPWCSAYRLSRTAKARQLESDIYNAIHRIGRDAEIAAAEAERKAMNLGLKAVETGAKVADKVAEEADKAVGKAKEKWEK